MTESERRALLFRATVAYVAAVSRLSTIGSPAWWWAVVNADVERELVERDVLPALVTQ